MLLMAAGIFIWTSRAQQEAPAVPGAPTARAAEAAADSGSPAEPPSADERTREQRRFDRADRNRDGRITLDELLMRATAPSPGSTPIMTGGCRSRNGRCAP